MSVLEGVIFAVCLSFRPWLPLAPPEAGKLVWSKGEKSFAPTKEGFPTRFACGNDNLFSESSNSCKDTNKCSFWANLLFF
jgi:hypothetical protein